TKYKLKIQCFKAVSYSFDGKIFLNIELIIPVKEAKDYTIKMAEKAQEEQNTQDELKNLQTLRIEFWKQFLQRFAMRSHLFSSISPSKVSWISASTGLGGVAWTFVFNNKLARTEV